MSPIESVLISYSNHKFLMYDISLISQESLVYVFARMPLAHRCAHTFREFTVIVFPHFWNFANHLARTTSQSPNSNQK